VTTLYEYTKSTPYDPSTGTQTGSEDISYVVNNPPAHATYTYSGTADVLGLSLSDDETYLHIGTWYAGSPGDPPDMVWTYKLTIPGVISGGKVLMAGSPFIQEGLDGDSMESIDIDSFVVNGTLLSVQGWNETLVTFEYATAT